MADVPLRKLQPEVVLSAYAGPERRRMARSPIADSQRSLPDIDFLPPETVPTQAEIVGRVPAKVRAHCAAALASGGAAFHLAIEALGRRIPASKSAPPCDLATKISVGDHADSEVLDYFFRIRRVSRMHPASFPHSLFRTLQVLRTDLEEAPSSLDDGRIAVLARGLTATAAAAIGSHGLDAKFEWVLAAQPLDEHYPTRRWIRGHQIFAALTQSLIFAFDAMDTAAATGDDAAMARCADLAATAMQACAAALEFTGDFPKQSYQDMIRTSMAQPYQPDGFSGLLSSDHRHLVRRMKATRATMDLLKEREPARHARIVEGLANVYESHKFVCGRFVGIDKSSLLMVKDAGRSAVEQLDRFKVSRLRAIGVDVPCGRT